MLTPPSVFRLMGINLLPKGVSQSGTSWNLESQKPMPPESTWSRRFKMVILAFSSLVRVGRPTGERSLSRFGFLVRNADGFWRLYLFQGGRSERFIPISLLSVVRYG